MYDKELSTAEGGVPIKVGDDTVGKSRPPSG
jgi:hypothetical protein